MSAMESMSCDHCGSSEFLEGKDTYTCCYCRATFKKERKAAATVIDVKSDVENLLRKCKFDPRNASRYASLILDIDPGNKEAHKYL